MYFIKFLLACFCVNVVYSSNKCGDGEKYWCQNYDTAAECGVVAFCHEKYPEFRKSKIVFKPKEQVKEVTNNAAKPVKVELYYESLCPGCREFITTQLFPVFQKVFSTGILDIGLYPYGNANERRVGERWEFTCQHGKEECEVNQLEACALHMLSHPSQFMPYIHCVEGAPGMENARACADKLQIEWGPISNCYNGTQGNHLMHELAEKTDALSPPHQYVPWIVVNGVHNNIIQNRAQNNLLQLVCETYTGVQPHACRVAAPKRSYK